jgi:hypothetical protein
MARTYCVDPEHQLVLLRPTGRFTERDFIALCRAAYAHPDRTPQYAHVWDTRFIDELVMDVDVISMFRDFLADTEARATEGKVAVITTRVMTETFASMLIQIGEQRPATFQLFTTVPAAAEWLELPAEALADDPDRPWLEP